MALFTNGGSSSNTFGIPSVIVVLFNQARHPHGLYSARQQSRLFDRENPRLRRSPSPTGFAEIVGDDPNTSTRGGFTAAFPRRVFGKRDRCAKGPRLGRALKAP